MFARAGSKSSNVSGSQLWQHHNKTNELWSAEVVGQRADYIHYNPVEPVLFQNPGIGSIAVQLIYAGGKGILAIDFL